jgi:hypothetical protein
MCSLIPEGGRDLGCLEEVGIASGLLGVDEVAILRASSTLPGC